MTNLKSALRELLGTTTEVEDDSRARELAAAGLMLEVATVDHHLDASEMQTLLQELGQQFHLDGETLHNLVERARNNASQNTSVYPFTRYVNDHFTQEEKFDLLTGMWRIAYADLNLDKYEEYTIRKIADLLHMSQSDFIRAKVIARDG
ncbi:TerB family tellurite resistance protein [Pseudomaricurvus sp. HS19]|nr:TerB family tellurite resistance protein [Pseudomaricurvus sp. HS19]